MTLLEGQGDRDGIAVQWFMCRHLIGKTMFLYGASRGAKCLATRHGNKEISNMFTCECEPKSKTYIVLLSFPVSTATDDLLGKNIRMAM